MPPRVSLADLLAAPLAMTVSDAVSVIIQLAQSPQTGRPRPVELDASHVWLEPDGAVTLAPGLFPRVSEFASLLGRLLGPLEDDVPRGLRDHPRARRRTRGRRLDPVAERLRRRARPISARRSWGRGDRAGRAVRRAASGRGAACAAHRPGPAPGRRPPYRRPSRRPSWLRPCLQGGPQRARPPSPTSCRCRTRRLPSRASRSGNRPSGPSPSRSRRPPSPPSSVARSPNLATRAGRPPKRQRRCGRQPTGRRRPSPSGIGCGQTPRRCRREARRSRYPPRPCLAVRRLTTSRLTAAWPPTRCRSARCRPLSPLGRPRPGLAHRAPPASSIGATRRPMPSTRRRSPGTAPRCSSMPSRRVAAP